MTPPIARVVAAFAAACGFVTSAAPANAQPTRGSWEVSGGGVFVGGYDLPDATAELTSNSGTTGAPFPYFSTENRIDAGTGFLGRIGFYVTPSFAVEGGVRYTRPVLAARISGDTENAQSVTAEEIISQYVFEGSAVWHFGRSPGIRSAMTPFVYGGGGYLRELHEGETLVEEGVEYHAGGGLKWWLGARRTIGVRVEAGFSIRDGGFDLEEKARFVPIAAGSFTLAF